MFRFLFVFAVMVFCGSGVVLAQEEVAEAPKPNPVVEAAKAFTDGLDEPSLRHFNTIYGNYNMVRVVEAVRGSIDSAVRACGEANPDMKEQMDTRFDGWAAEVNPILKEADSNIDNLVLAQDYAQKKDFEKFFKLIDKTRDEAEKEVKKIPVTSPEACGYLLKNMDKTQAQMTELLRATLISLPQRMQAQDDDARAKAIEEEAEKAEAEKAEAEAIEAEAAEEAVEPEDAPEDGDEPSEE